MEERKLKPQKQRKPKEILSLSTAVQNISKKTGFKNSDIKLVCDLLFMEMKEGLISKKQVKLPGMGILYPVIKRSRVGVNLNGNKGKPVKCIVPDRWISRYQARKTFDAKLSKLKVTEQELDAMYYPNKN